MAKGKGTGFLTALILAVVSFFVIFFFFPEASVKYLGVSFKKNPAVMDSAKEKTQQIVNSVADDVAEKVSESVKNLISK